jgi:putative addiction module component (TIGR02574 family)
MSLTAEKIVAEALELSPDARAFVAERLIESLDASSPSDLSPAWREEIRRRCREVDQGTVELRAAADVFANAYAALG